MTVRQLFMGVHQSPLVRTLGGGSGDSAHFSFRMIRVYFEEVVDL
jgi:hypothetical protein